MQREFVAAPGPRPILVTDTITILEPGDEGAVIVSGSHGGVSSAQFVLGRSLAGVFYNDAGVGKDEAGIAGLAILDRVGLPAVAVDHRSAVIGHGADTWQHGVVSHANGAAAARGVRPGQAVEAAAGLLSQGTAVSTEGTPAQLNRQTRQVGEIETLLLDSISMLRAEGGGRIVVTGSHGGAVSAEFAARHRPALTIFNDAGIGKDDAGCAALALLSEVGLAALAVDCRSGRIGDPADMLEHGLVSRCNREATQLGVRPGQSLREAIAAVAGRLR